MIPYLKKCLILYGYNHHDYCIIVPVIIFYNTLVEMYFQSQTFHRVIVKSMGFVIRIKRLVSVYGFMSLYRNVISSTSCKLINRIVIKTNVNEIMYQNIKYVILTQNRKMKHN